MNTLFSIRKLSLGPSNQLGVQNNYRLYMSIVCRIIDYCHFASDVMICLHLNLHNSGYS